VDPESSLRRELMTGIEERGVRISGPGGVVDGRWTISSRPPWRLVLHLADREYSAEEDDLFECLTVIRRELERQGRRPCCRGAQADVYPSGMARQMGGGRTAYQHRTGRRPGRADLVDIFDEAECADVVSVDEQERAVMVRRDH
jgi:hypothetical protein